MAKDKKSFIMYADLIHVVKKLVEQDRKNKTNHAGELFLHVLEYVNDKDPVPIDFIVDMAFEPIKAQLKRDLNKYKTKQEQWSKAGKASAEKRRETKKKSTDVASRSTVSTDTVTVNDTVNVTVTDTVITKQPAADADFDAFLLSFNSITGKKFMASDKRKRALRARLREGNTLEQIALAVRNCFNSDYHKENPHYLTPDFILRQDKLEMYLNYSKPNISNVNATRLPATNLPGSAIIQRGKQFGNLREYRSLGTGSK